MNEKILKVEDLHVDFHLGDRVIPAVDGVSFSLSKGKPWAWLESQDAERV